jgi:hypothetical protein
MLSNLLQMQSRVFLHEKHQKHGFAVVALPKNNMMFLVGNPTQVGLLGRFQPADNYIFTHGDNVRKHYISLDFRPKSKQPKTQ